jgi:hypothetical protein
MRYSNNQIQQGQTPRFNLTPDLIMRLEEIGFRWNVIETFEQRFRDLETFKCEFGHYHIPHIHSQHLSLANWCSKIRCAYNKVQRGQTPRINLTQDQIMRLGEIGFKWKTTYH